MAFCLEASRYDVTFCPLIMGAGRPQKADPGTLYAFAHQFYWDFRRLLEGGVRWRVDKKAAEQLTSELERDVQLNEEQKARAEQVAEEEVRSGLIKEAEKEARRRDIEDSQLTVTRDWLQRLAIEKSTRELRIPGEPEVIESLLDPNTTPEQIRVLCKGAFMKRTVRLGSETREVDFPAWPIPPGSAFPTYLSEFAEDYVLALHDPRF